MAVRALCCYLTYTFSVLFTMQLISSATSQAPVVLWCNSVHHYLTVIQWTRHCYCYFHSRMSGDACENWALPLRLKMVDKKDVSKAAGLLR